MEQITLKLNDTLYNPLLILETFNNIKLPKWLGRAMLSDLLIAGRVVPKVETPNEPTPVLAHSLTDCDSSEKVHFQNLRADCI